MQKVCQHLRGFLKNHLSSDDKQELLGLIEDYRQGLLPLIVPLTLLKHDLSRYSVPGWAPPTRDFPQVVASEGWEAWFRKNP